jgi:hypothetical protein
MSAKTKLLLAMFLLVVLALSIPHAWAKSIKPTFAGSLKLSEKDISGNVVTNAALAELKYNVNGSTFDFTLDANGLLQNTLYALIRSQEPETVLPYPGYYDIIKEGTSDSLGSIAMAGSYNFDDDLVSAKFLLVPVSMLNVRTDGRPSPSGRFLSGQGIIVGYHDTETNLKCGCQSSGTNFSSVGLPIGAKAIDFTLETTDFSPSNVRLTYNLFSNLTKPVVLITGAFT